jgi:putative PIN family toxin of toxin-antitoxin system
LTWLRAARAARTVAPVVCRETVTELLRVLAYPKFRLTPEDRNTLLAQYLPFSETGTLPSVRPKLPAVCRDRDDTVFIALMLSAGADLLVSGDADLTVPRDTVGVISVTDPRVMLDGDG